VLTAKIDRKTKVIVSIARQIISEYSAETQDVDLTVISFIVYL